MGEVYRAVDARLGRSVAIKILPASLREDARLRTRFEREAKVISNLSHPNICAIHDVGRDDGIDYLVLELLDGQTLADRLAGAALPLSDALRIGIEIASALHCAHRSGIVHRDVKPGNVMLTKNGAKLLDFGLAKSAEDEPVSAAAATAAHPLTSAGTTVGTVQYMSPEQLTGAAVDSRSDIFALGAVLYELLTGRRAFDGPTRPGIATAILTSDAAPFEQLHGDSSPALARIVTTCLMKDPEQRWQSAHDVALELKAVRDGSPAQPARGARPLRWVAAIVAVVAAGAAGYLAAHRVAVAAPRLHAAIIAPPNSQIASFVIAPKGNIVAMIAQSATWQRIWFEDLTNGSMREVAESDRASAVCFSPDGNSIAFVRGGQLLKAAVSGGPTTLLADNLGFTPGLAWGADDTIIFARDDTGGINRISAAGGPWSRVTNVLPADHRHLWPSFLPDGKHFLFVVDGRSPSIEAASLDPREAPHHVLDNVSGNAAYAEGMLLFVRGGTLIAQPFDAERFRITGSPRVVAEQVADLDFRHSAFSAGGQLLGYSTFDPRSRLHLVDRGGRDIATFGEPAEWVSVSWSPNGKQAVVERTDADARSAKLWLADLDRNVFNEFVSDSEFSVGGMWSPDGTEVMYQTEAGVFVKRPDGSGVRKMTLLDPSGAFVSTWAGEWVGEEVSGMKSHLADVVAVSLRTGQRISVADSPAWENVASFSGDSKWIAYAATGKVIVQPFPPTGAQYIISSRPAGFPRWRADGRELFFSEYGGALVSVPISVKDGKLDAGVANTLFTARVKGYKNRVPYDVSPDGQHFLLNMQDSYARDAHIVMNWTSSISGKKP